MGRVARYKRIKACDPFTKKKPVPEDPKWNQPPSDEEDDFVATHADVFDKSDGTLEKDGFAVKASKPVVTKVRQDEEKFGLRGLKGLGAVPAPTSSNSGGGGGAKSSSGFANSEARSSSAGGSGPKAPKPVTSLSKRSLKRARKLGILTDEDIAIAKQSKRSKPNNTQSEDGGDAVDGAGDGSESSRPAPKSNKKAGASAPAEEASAVAPVRAQILAGQSLLEQDLRFVNATRKLGRGLQDGYAQKRKTTTKLEARRPGESLLEFKRRTKKDVRAKLTKIFDNSSSTKQKKKEYLDAKKADKQAEKRAQKNGGSSGSNGGDDDDNGGSGDGSYGNDSFANSVATTAKGRAAELRLERRAQGLGDEGEAEGHRAKKSPYGSDERMPAKPTLVGLHRVEEHLMAPPSFSAKQLPRYATPKSNAQKRAAAAAPSGGSAAGTAGGGGANKNSSSSDGSAAAAKSARAKVEMEAMRLRVVEQYKELKLKQHAEKEHVKGARR